MGAHGFSTYSPGSDMQSAFRKAKEQASFEYGADPYNGTISTVRSCSAVLHKSVPKSSLGAVEAALWEREDGRTIRKWESCAAVPVSSDENFDWKDEELVLSIATDRGEIWQGDVEAAAKEKLGLASDACLKDVEYEVLEESGSPDVFLQDFPEKYLLMIDGHLQMQNFSSLSEAKEFAVKRAKQSGKRVDVIPFGGHGQAVVLQEKTWNVKVRFSWTSPRSAPVEGWYFFGLASC